MVEEKVGIEIEIYELCEEIDKVLSDKYGGEVFDFSDKNYTLYAHVLSRNEDIVDILNSLTDKKVSEIVEDDVEELKSLFKELKDSFFNDLNVLLENENFPNVKTRRFLCNQRAHSVQIL